MSRWFILLLAASHLAGEAAPDANKAAVRRFLEQAWFGGKMDVVDEVFAASFQSHDPRSPQAIQAKPEYQKAVIRQWSEAAAGISGRIDDLVAEGDRVAARWTWRVQLAGWYQRVLAGRDYVETPVFQIFRFENGKVAELWSFRDDQGLQDQLGSFKLSYLEGFLLGAVSTMILGRIFRRQRAARAAAGGGSQQRVG